MSLLKNILTGKDNITFDMGRVSWFLSILALFAHDAWQLAHGVQTNVKDLAIALSTISAAHGAAIKLKENTEPIPDEKKDGAA